MTVDEPTRLTRDDLYLFNEGSLVNLYEKLGAHPGRVNGQDGTFFAVWAPEQTVTLRNGTLLVVPADSAQQSWAQGTHGVLSFGDIQVELPTDRELRTRSQEALDRMGRGEPP